MSLIQNPAYILTVLFLLIIIAEWIATKKYFKQIGAVTIVILLGAIAANIKIIPSSTNVPAIYNLVFDYAAPLGIFFLLLDVRLKDLKFAGLPMLSMFLAGAAATTCGVLIGYYFLSPQHHNVSQANVVAGMFAGTYTGGSANLNAVALNYNLTSNGTLYAAVNAVDNILTTAWIFVTMFLPPILFKILPRKKTIPPVYASGDEKKFQKSKIPVQNNLIDISLLLALAFGSYFISNQLSALLPRVPSILTLTIFALLLAQIPFVQKLKGGKTLGMFLIMLFLVVIGAFCDIAALIRSGDMAGTLLAWDTILIFVHGIIIILIGLLFRQDWDLVFVASNANVGGATSAPVCAASLGRSDLQLPGILAGSVGSAIGTFIGLFIAEFLK